MLAFPYFFLFELLGPVVETLGYVVVILSFVLGLINLKFFLMFVAVAILYGTFLSIAAILLEEISFRRYPGWMDLSKLILFSILENLGYRQLLSLFKVKAFWDVLLGRKTWGRMDRTGFRATPRSGDANQRA
jgi:hypothetical protein